MKIAIIGGGPAALMAADILSKHVRVELYEKEKNIGRKFLVAGKGGFNLTNSLDGEMLIAQYTPDHFLRKALRGFGSQALRNWLAQLGIPTFTGSSGRVFPQKGIKPAEILKKIKSRLVEQGVSIHLNRTFTGFNKAGQPMIRHPEGEQELKADYFIFALGGASWPKTGSTGNWTSSFASIGVTVVPFQASNCGININWPLHLKQHHAGKPLKNIHIGIGKFKVKGEALISEYGLEGNAIYPLVPVIREALSKEKATEIIIDLKPFNTKASLLEKFGDKKASTASYSKVFRLNTSQLALVKAFLTKTEFQDPEFFVNKLKNLEIPVIALRPVEEAISTIGGIALSELNPDFSLKKFPNIYTIGEMLDWDAPTGGFLLQACFAMGHSAAKAILRRKS